MADFEFYNIVCHADLKCISFVWIKFHPMFLSCPQTKEYGNWFLIIPYLSIMCNFRLLLLILTPAFVSRSIYSPASLSISYFEHAQKRKSYTYTTQITVLDMNNQGSTLLTTKPLYNKPFHKFSYHKHVALYLPY